MDIEFATDHLCNRFLASLNSVEAEIVLEIGLGSLNFSFQWAAPLGFRCVAVEPLPTESLLVATNQNGIELVMGAMGAQSWEVPIYHGVLHDHDFPDISSLNPRWWGVSERSSIVPCLTLPELCIYRSIDRIALLKVDTEGSEYHIISFLPELQDSIKPRVIAVEYGGEVILDLHKWEAGLQSFSWAYASCLRSDRKKVFCNNCFRVKSPFSKA